MNEREDPLLKDMMMDSKQFIKNPEFGNMLMNQIKQRDKKKVMISNALFYSMPVCCTVLVMLLFSGTVMREANQMTIHLSSDHIYLYLQDVFNQYHLLIIVIVMVFVRGWMAALKQVQIR